jgi:NAD(P)-dependent dehydrogenase (short-subunit alcohol dehydrogenase family)
LLTGLLLDLIKKSAPSRIINVSSMTHSSSIDFDDLQGEKYYSGYSAYSLSKLCNIFFTYELAERLQGTGVTVNCLHPGVIDTKLLRTNFSGGRPVFEGSKTSVYLATAPELENVTGKYFMDKRETRSSHISYDPEVRKKL